MKSKHIDIKFLVVKESVQSRQVFIEHIGTNSIVVDRSPRDCHLRSFMNTLLI